MQRITFSNQTTSKPRLEIRQGPDGDARSVEVDRSPFTIGRAETADCRIDSAQISREHAQLLDRGGMWLVRDLGSMNGTQVNGKTVTESLLSDGDILTIAETDLTFVASTASQFQRMVTQPIQSRQRPAAPISLPAEVLSARAMTESTLWQAIPVELLQVVTLGGQQTEAIFAGQSASDDEHPWPPAGMRHAAADRYRELQRIRAVEVASEKSSAATIFVVIDHVEIESPNRLLSGLERLQELLPADSELGVTISLRTILDTLKYEEIYRAVRDLGLLVAFDEFQGSGAQVLHLDAMPSDYLLLCASMLKDVTMSRQPLRRLESVRTACEQLAIKPVLPPTQSEHTLALCGQIGYDLMLRSGATHQEVAPAGHCVAQ